MFFSGIFSADGKKFFHLSLDKVKTLCYNNLIIISVSEPAPADTQSMLDKLNKERAIIMDFNQKFVKEGLTFDDVLLSLQSQMFFLRMFLSKHSLPKTSDSIFLL